MKSTLTRDMGNDIRNRGVFDGQAQIYNKVRPHYPEALFDALVDETHLTSGARLLEIGPGTGQATVPLAQRGYNIVAVELGSQLAAIAREQLGEYGNARVITGAFEDISLPDKSFDLIYSATALHWVKEGARYTKPHRLLKSSGYLAIIQANHVSDGQGDVFFHASQPIYDKYTPGNGGAQGLPQTKDLKPTADLDTKLFKLTYFKCFPLIVEYSADEYAKLLGTISSHLALEPTVRTVFLSSVKKLIDDEFDGRVTKNYEMSLTIARKI